LYIDLKKEAFKKLGFRRMNAFTLWPALFGKKTRETIAETKEKKVAGDLAGDWWQNGGTLVINKDGKALLTFRQETPGEHVDPNEVLKALGIEGKVEVEDHGAAECGAEACAMPSRPKQK
ncbi:prostamide/prostaglandin F synthase, partial [Biomphalaria pfeifferi]